MKCSQENRHSHCKFDDPLIIIFFLFLYPLYYLQQCTDSFLSFFSIFRVATDRKHKNVNLYRKIRGCLYNRELLKDISPLGIHFLESLIEINPTKRFAASEALCHPWLKYHNIVPYSFSCQIEPKTQLFSVFSRVLVTNVLRTDSGKEKINNSCDSCSNNVQTNQNVLDMKRCTLLNAGNVRDSFRELKHIKEQKLKENRNIIHDHVSTKVNRRSSVISRLVNRFRMALVL